MILNMTPYFYLELYIKETRRWCIKLEIQTGIYVRKLLFSGK